MGTIAGVATGYPMPGPAIQSCTMIMKLFGIVIDTMCQELRLPEEKLKRLLDLLRTWRELESLLEIVQHACKVICPGRALFAKLPPYCKAKNASNWPATIKPRT